MASKARQKPKTTLPFLFLGQGDAQYYEWFEMWVWFEASVPKAMRAKLLAGGPAPCLLDATWPHPDLLWPSTGDQEIDERLTEAYGTSDQTAFNDEIERWLLAMHAKCPILFVARCEDLEAGGTKLGKWHEASVAAFSERVLPTLEALSKTKSKLGKDDVRRTPITLALNYVGPDRFAPAIRELANQEALTKVVTADEEAEDEIVAALEGAFIAQKLTAAAKGVEKLKSAEGRLRALVALTDAVFCRGADLDASGAHTLVVSMIDAFAGRKLSAALALPLAKEKLSPHLVAGAYAGALQAAAWAKDAKAFDTVARLVDEAPEVLRSYVLDSAEALRLKRPDFAARMSGSIGGPTPMELCTVAMKARDPKRALEIYEEAMALPEPPWQVVNNGLVTLALVYPRKLPSEVTDRWLARGLALASGPVDHCVACLLMRLGRPEEACERAILALERGADREAIRVDPDLAALHEHPAFIAALKQKKPEPKKKNNA